VVVSVEYFGYPSVSARQRQLPGSEEPWLLLASCQVTLDAAGAADFPDVALDPGRLQMVEEGRPHVRVDVFSSGAGGDEAAEDNLLDCGTFQGALAAAVREGVDIDCKLIAE